MWKAYYIMDLLIFFDFVMTLLLLKSLADELAES